MRLSHHRTYGSRIRRFIYSKFNLRVVIYHRHIAFSPKSGKRDCRSENWAFILPFCYPTRMRFIPLDVLSGHLTVYDSISHSVHEYAWPCLMPSLIRFLRLRSGFFQSCQMQYRSRLRSHSSIFFSLV